MGDPTIIQAIFHELSWKHKFLVSDTVIRLDSGDRLLYVGHNRDLVHVAIVISNMTISSISSSVDPSDPDLMEQLERLIETAWDVAENCTTTTLANAPVCTIDQMAQHCREYYT